MSSPRFNVNALDPDTADLPELVVPPPVTALPWLVTAYGHSIVQGSDDSWGAQSPNRFTSRLALRLRAQEVNHGVGASPLSSDNEPNRPGAGWATSGGWVTVLQTADPAPRPQPPILCPQQLVVLMSGHLEFALSGPERTARVYPGTLRTVLRRLRAGTVYPDTHETVHVLGPHTRFEGNTRNSGNGMTLITSDQATVDIHVPEWYPGGLAIDFGGTYYEHASADVKITLDGEDLGVYEVSKLAPATVDHENPELTPWSYRIDGSKLSPGKHKIRLEYVNVRQWGSFNYWQIEASQTPLILLPEVPRFPGVFDMAGGLSNYNVPEEGRVLVDGLQRAVAREFEDGGVVYVKLQDLLDPDAPLYTDDGLHPNGDGADLIAERMYDAVVANWTRDHARTTGFVQPVERSPREVQIQKVRSRVGLVRRRLLP